MQFEWNTYVAAPKHKPMRIHCALIYIYIHTANGKSAKVSTETHIINKWRLTCYAAYCTEWISINTYEKSTAAGNLFNSKTKRNRTIQNYLSNEQINKFSVTQRRTNNIHKHAHTYIHTIRTNSELNDRNLKSYWVLAIKLEFLSA